MRLATILLVLCAAFLPRAGHAQFRDQLYTSPVLPAPAVSAVAPAEPVLLLALPANAVADARMQRGGASTPVLILGGAVGSGVGLVAGGVLGALLDPADPDCIDFCFGPGFVVGLLAGQALGMAGGVHVVNGRRGSLPMGMLTTAGILAVGLVAGNNHPEALLVVPVSQLVGAIWTERRTDRRR